MRVKKRDMTDWKKRRIKSKFPFYPQRIENYPHHSPEERTQAVQININIQENYGPISTPTSFSNIKDKKENQIWTIVKDWFISKIIRK